MRTTKTKINLFVNLNQQKINECYKELTVENSELESKLLTQSAQSTTCKNVVCKLTKTNVVANWAPSL